MANDSVLLKDLLVFTKDGEWGKGEAGEGLIEMSVIRGTDFEDVRLGDTGSVPLRYIPEQIAARKRLQPGDILLETAGGTKDQPTGRTVFLKKHFFERHQTRPFTCASFSRFLRVDSSLADSEYVYWYLKHLYFTGEMYLYHVQHTGVARFQYTEFAAKTRIPLPPLPTQRAIARILGALDDKIELNRRQSATLEALARAVFQSWFMDFDPVRARAAGRAPAAMDAATAALFPDGFDVVDGREVPRGWKLTYLREVAKFIKGLSYKSSYLQDSPTALVTLKSIGRGGGYRDEGLKPYTGEYKSEQVVQPGEIVVAHTDLTQAAEVLGRPALVRPHQLYSTLVASLDLMVVRPMIEWVSREFLYDLLGREGFREHAYGYSNGTTVLHLSVKALPEYLFVLPSPEVVQAFTTRAQPLYRKLEQNELQSRTLAALRDALLPRLLSGELRVRTAERLVAERV